GRGDVARRHDLEGHQHGAGVHLERRRWLRLLIRATDGSNPAMSGTPSVPGMADSFKRSLRACDHAAMRVADLRRVVGRLDGVAERRRGGLLDWRYHGRLVARQLD